MTKHKHSRIQTHARSDEQMGHFASREKEPGELAWDWESKSYVDQGLSAKVMKQHTAKKRRQRGRQISEEGV